ncbi:MAG: hypothetical protein AAB596_02845 [Patescibacteria group bacterium]
MRFQALLLMIVISFALLVIKVDGNNSQKAISIANIEAEDSLVESEASAQTFGDYFINQNNRSELLVQSNPAVINEPQNSSLNNETDILLEEIGENQISFENCADTISAKGAILRNVSQNADLIELDGKKRWPLASITKLMTAVVAIENLGKEKEIAISEKAESAFGEAGGIKTGEVFKAIDLIKAMLVVSSNDAGVALAENPNEQDFIFLMNKKADELKMTDTHFFDSTGLSFLNQSTTEDLVKLVHYINAQSPEIFEISRQKEIKITELISNKSRKLANINQFSGQNNFLGGKTGHTDEAGRNLISLFNRNNQMLLAIILGAEDAFKETEKLINCVY